MKIPSSDELRVGGAWTNMAIRRRQNRTSAQAVPVPGIFDSASGLSIGQCGYNRVAACVAKKGAQQDQQGQPKSKGAMRGLRALNFRELSRPKNDTHARTRGSTHV